MASKIISVAYVKYICRSNAFQIVGLKRHDMSML
jgi:hypothetical protein